MANRLCIRLMPVILLPILGGCSSKGTSVEARQQFAIQYTEDVWVSSKNAVQSQWGKDLLVVLKTANVKTISNPILASAVFSKGRDKSYGLFAIWVEKYPSVDAVEFQYSAQLPSIVIPIPEQELKQNETAAKTTVVFGAEYRWGETSQEWRRMEEISSTKDIKVRLLRAHLPVTEWLSARFYKVDHWSSE